jgi:hypothetical protein
VKLDPGTYKGNAFSFDLKTGCDTNQPTLPGVCAFPP